MEELCKRKKKELDKLFYDGESSGRRFVRQSDVRRLWTTKDLDSFLPFLTTDGIQTTAREQLITLSILIMSGQLGYQRYQYTLAWSIVGQPEFFDEQLPFDSKVLREFLGPAVAEDFHRTQFLFLPRSIPVSQQSETLSLNGPNPWPLLESPRMLGSGRHGEVWQVKVAPGFLIDQDSGSSNASPRVVAYKRFKSTAGVDRELDKPRYLGDNALQHDRIVRHFGTIRTPREFYILFDHTSLADLEVFLNGGLDATTGRVVYDFGRKFPYAQSSDIIEQMTGIADGLKFLHENSPTSTARSVRPLQLDLKPSNILVFSNNRLKNSGSGVGKWLISDFGISFRNDGTRAQPIKAAAENTFPALSAIDLGSSREIPRSTLSAQVMPCEAATCQHHVDFFSLGCALTEVLAFIIGSSTGAENQRTLNVEAGVSRVSSLHEQISQIGGTSLADSRLPTEKARVRQGFRQWIQHERVLSSAIPQQMSIWRNKYIDLVLRMFEDDCTQPQAVDVLEELRSIQCLMRGNRTPNGLDSTSNKVSSLAGLKYGSHYAGRPTKMGRLRRIKAPILPRRIQCLQIGPRADKIAYIFRENASSKQRLAILGMGGPDDIDEWKTLGARTLTDAFNWKRIVLTDSYLIAVSDLTLNTGVCLFEVTNMRQIDTSRLCMRPFSNITVSSQGTLAWDDAGSGIHLLTLGSTQIVEKWVPKGLIIHTMFFNTSGSMFFVQSTDHVQWFIFTFDMLNPSSELVCIAQFSRANTDDLDPAIWSTDSSNACLIRCRCFPSTYFHVSGLKIGSFARRPLNFNGITPHLLALCDRWLVFTALEGGKIKLFKRRFTIGRRGLPQAKNEVEVVEIETRIIVRAGWQTDCTLRA